MTGEDPKVILNLLSYNSEYEMQSLHVCACVCRIDKIYIYVYIQSRNIQTKGYIFSNRIYNATTRTNLLFPKCYRKANLVADSAWRYRCRIIH